MDSFDFSTLFKLNNTQQYVFLKQYIKNNRDHIDRCPRAFKTFLFDYYFDLEDKMDSPEIIPTAIHTNANPVPQEILEQYEVQEQEETESVVSNMSASSSASATPSKKKQPKVPEDETVQSIKRFIKVRYVDPQIDMDKVTYQSLYNQFLDFSGLKVAKVEFGKILSNKFCLEPFKSNKANYFRCPYEVLKVMIDPDSYKPIDFHETLPKPQSPEPEPEEQPEQAEEQEPDEIDNLEDEDIDFVEESLKSPEVIRTDFKRMKIKRINC